tara:strand:+ start:126 stop:407 length:282 start_codon:yes stop_codon:yes gene_type:complete
MKELFALYLTFLSPIGEVELFVRELPSCESADVIADEEFKNRGIDRNQYKRTGYICIGWESHLARQRLMKGLPLDPKYIPIQQKKCIVSKDIN